jgi:hypothetical protein
VGKDKGTKTRKLARRATFVRGKHLTLDRAGAPARTLNVVQRAALNKDAPPMRAAQVGGKPTVFFKPHSGQNAPSQYAVASTRLARFLGMDNLIAHNAFAKVKSILGAVSGAVPGSPLYSVEKKKEVYRPDAYSKSETPNWVRDKQLDERDGKYFDVSKKVYQWIDFADPKIQKGMSDLQLFDAITGQSDRHGGNIFVDPATGEVSGIDDDKSFGKGVKAADQATPQTDFSFYRALPELVDEETAEAILKLDPTNLPEQLLPAETDSKELTEKEIEEAVRRFVGVQLYLRDLQKKGALVGQNGTSWNQATYDHAMADPTTNYLGYQAVTLQNALQQSATDPMIEVVGAPAAPPPPPPVPIGLTLAQALAVQPAPPGSVQPTTINQPPATVLLPARRPGADRPPTMGASRAARSRLDATRPRPWVGALPMRPRESDADTDESGTTTSEEDGNPSSD